MNFYNQQHKYYCGIDLHTNKMYLCILDEPGEIQLHRNIKTDREIFLSAIKPFREDIVVAVECMVTLLNSLLIDCIRFQMAICNMKLLYLYH